MNAVAKVSSIFIHLSGRQIQKLPKGYERPAWKEIIALLQCTLSPPKAFAGVGRLVHRFHEQEEALAHLDQRGAKSTN
jgi:hypothetical protein